MNIINSMLETISQNTGIHTDYLIIGIVLGIILFILIDMILLIVVLCKLKNVKRKHETFMKGKNAESLEETLVHCINRVELVDEVNKTLLENIATLEKVQKNTYQKIGIIKYDAFREMSGELSYVLVLLDQKDNGFVMNSVYTREGGYSYIKEVKNGEADVLLSEEEVKGLEKAKTSI